MKRLIFVTCIVSLLGVAANAQWIIVRERFQEEGRHTYLSLTSVDGNVIYVCGAKDGGIGNVDDYVIEKSTDGGYTWVKQNTSAFPQFPVAINDKFHGIKTLDGINVIVIGDSGLIATSHDGGIEWTVRNFGSRLNLFDVDINASGTAVVTGNYGAVGISYDTGRTWQFKEFIGSTTFLSCKVFGRDTIYLVDRFYANFFRSFDGGVTWDSVKIFPIHFDGNKGVQNFGSHFWNSKEGLIVGLNKEENSGYQIYNDFIARTTDGGATWSTVMDTLQSGGLVRINFCDQNSGIIGARSKYILKTSDAGLTWQRDSIDIDDETVLGAYDVLRTKSSYVVIAKTELGDGEVALYTPNSEAVANPSRQFSDISIFPNPATSAIFFASHDKMKITIINVLGKVIEQLTSHGDIFEYNCSKLPVGSYFVRAISKSGDILTTRFIKQ